MADEERTPDLPISWDEAREVVVVVLLASAVLRLLGPLAGFIDDRWGAFSDDVAELTRNASPTTGLMVLAAGVLIATTPRNAVVPSLRRATVVVASIVLLEGVIAIGIELTRVSGAGVLGRLETIFSRFLPAVLFAGTGRWLAAKVVPFDD
ncbi:MAG: hypothetical protein AAGA90_22350 [Actinomycetota bacterium]